MSATEEDAIQKVLTGYYEAYGRDSAAASAFFGEPIMVVLPTEVVLISTRAELATFFDRFVAANLAPNGYSHSKVGECRVRLLNSTTALCSAVAIRMKTDFTEMQRTGFTYLLRKSDERWQLLEIIATDLDKLST